MRMYHVVWATFSLLQRTQVPEIYARLVCTPWTVLQNDGPNHLGL